MSQELIDFWGTTLKQVTIDSAILPLLTGATAAFLNNIGLPTTEKMDTEKRHYLSLAIRPQLRYMINSKMIELFPYFQFAHFLDKQVEFGGTSFVLIGHQPEQYGPPSMIALKAVSDELYLINKQSAADRSRSGTYESISFLNSGCYELLRCLMEILTLDRAVAALRSQYYDVISSNAPNMVEADALYQTMENHVAVTEKHLMHIDLRAMQDSSNPWVGLINDMKSFGP